MKMETKVLIPSMTLWRSLRIWDQTTRHVRVRSAIEGIFIKIIIKLNGITWRRRTRHAHTKSSQSHWPPIEKTISPISMTRRHSLMKVTRWILSRKTPESSPWTAKNSRISWRKRKGDKERWSDSAITLIMKLTVKVMFILSQTLILIIQYTLWRNPPPIRSFWMMLKMKAADWLLEKMPTPLVRLKSKMMSNSQTLKIHLDP